MEREAETTMPAAVVRLPYDVTRGWEWGWPVVTAVMFSVASWAHVTGRLVGLSDTPWADEVTWAVERDGQGWRSAHRLRGCVRGAGTPRWA